MKFILAMIPDWQTNDTRKESVAKAIEAINGLSSTRNSWVHNVWSADVTVGGGGIFVINERAPRGGNQLKPVKAHDIRHHTQAVIARTKALRDILFPPVP